MKVISAPVGRLVLDSYPFSISGGLATAQNFASMGAKGVALYLGAATAKTLQDVLGAGMGAFGVTLAGHYDGQAGVKQAQAMGFPKGASMFLDLEGLTAYHTDPLVLISMIQAWSLAMVTAGYKAGLYVGSPQPLTSEELWKLTNITMYWRGQGRIVDRLGNLAEPTKCGWCLTQSYPSALVGGVLTDSNLVGQDYLGRCITLVVA